MCLKGLVCDMWKVCSKPFKNVARIFPTQQRDVYTLIQSYTREPSVRRIIIFGSSITSACNPWSDIDVYVELDKEKNLPASGVTEVPVDLWTNYSVDKHLYSEIKKGVTVYVRNAS